MKDSINIGKGMDRIIILNLDDSYDEPSLAFEREGIINTKEYVLNEWQIDGLIDLVRKYLKSKLTFEQRKTHRLEKELKGLEDLKKNIQLRLNKRR